MVTKYAKNVLKHTQVRWILDNVQIGFPMVIGVQWLRMAQLDLCFKVRDVLRGHQAGATGGSEAVAWADGPVDAYM